MSYFAALFFLAILACLATAGFFMLRKGDQLQDADRSRKMAHALTLRMLLSIALFVCLLAAWKLGYIQPTGLPMTSK